MKKILFYCIVLFQAACSFTPSQTNTTGLPKNPPKKVIYLKDKTKAQIERVLGVPVIERVEQNKSLWAYRMQGCSTLVFFDENGVSKYAETRGDCGSIQARLN